MHDAVALRHLTHTTCRHVVAVHSVLCIYQYFGREENLPVNFELLWSVRTVVAATALLAGCWEDLDGKVELM